MSEWKPIATAPTDGRELVEKVGDIIRAHIAACEPTDAIARAAIAAVAEWLEVCVATPSAYITADNLREQLEAKE